MSTGTAIIQEALQEIGVHSIASPAGAESIEFGMMKLNAMLELWLSKNIRIGFTPLKVPGDDINEPADARNAIVSNLALLLAPAFDNGKQIVSPQLKSNANLGFIQMARLYKKIIVPDKVVSSTLPVGAGNQRSSRSRTFFGKKATING